VVIFLSKVVQALPHFTLLVFNLRNLASNQLIWGEGFELLEVEFQSDRFALLLQVLCDLFFSLIVDLFKKALLGLEFFILKEGRIK